MGIIETVPLSCDLSEGDKMDVTFKFDSYLREVHDSFQDIQMSIWPLTKFFSIRFFRKVHRKIFQSTARS